MRSPAGILQCLENIEETDVFEISSKNGYLGYSQYYDPDL